MTPKISKALLVSEFSSPWNTGFYIREGLRQNNVEVKIFDPKTAVSPFKELNALMDSFKPDALFYLKDYRLKPEWLDEARKRGILLVQWYPDLAIQDWLPPFVKQADIFFTMAEGLVEEFKKYNQNVFWVSQGFEPSMFQVEDITPKDREIFTSDLTFVGTLGSKQYYLKRRKYLKRVISEDFKFKWWGPRLPRKFSTLPLLLGRIGRSYGGRFIWGEEFAKVAQLSKIFLAFDAIPEIRKSMSARMYTAVGCGAFYMCEHVEGIEEVLVPGKEIVTFRSEEEMIDQIKYYLAHDEARKKIAETGRKRVLKDHTYKIRIQQILRTIEDVC